MNTAGETDRSANERGQEATDTGGEAPQMHELVLDKA